MYVRDGLVYYRALKSDRRSLDAYLATLERTALDGWSREEQVAFWLNAYDALVLRTVINRYPIAGTSREYPSKSIRQIAGAFERTTHKVAGRAVTLDAIEGDILNGFGDPRVFLALGRGSVGGGRLRSEAFTGAQLETQLQQVADRVPDPARAAAGRRGGAAGVRHADRQLAPGELHRGVRGSRRPALRHPQPDRAGLVAFTLPNLLPAERSFVQANEFALVFHDYDWRLNDLTGGAPR